MIVTKRPNPQKENVPYPGNGQLHAEELARVLKTYTGRLNLFRLISIDFPMIWHFPEEFASDGFIPCFNYDEVVCVHCRIQLRNWDIQDVVSEVHRLESPNCPFVLGKVENRPPCCKEEEESEDTVKK